MKKFITALRDTLLRYYIHYFVKIDPLGKCPSCGIRQSHPIKYDSASKKVLNWCRTRHADERATFGCGAIWSSDCLVNPANWESVIQTQETEGNVEVKQPESVFTGPVEVTREPHIVKTKAVA